MKTLSAIWPDTDVDHHCPEAEQGGRTVMKNQA
jgi:hypothetical protein